MPRFQDLSNELVLGILEEVLPDDIESVSLASRSIYQLAIPRLEEHRRLRKQYTNFKNTVQYKDMHWHDPGGLLANLFCDIMTDARIGHYVKKIDLDLWNSYARDGWQPDQVFVKQTTTSKSRLRQDSKTSMDIIEEAIRATKIIPTEEVDDWLHQIRLGNEDPLVALLFLHAPGLHTLKFVSPYSPGLPSYLLKTIQRVAGQGSAANTYSSHFENVEIYFAEGWENEGLDFVKAFMSLPSITSVKTESLFVDDRAYEANSAILQQPSNVMNLSFRSGFLPQQALSELLRGVRNLKTFTYNFTHLWRDHDYTPPFDCLNLMKSLEANVSHTLENLKLSAPKLETSQLAPIRGFSALREFEIQTSRCFFLEESNIAAFTSVLPVSIERLSLRWYEVRSVDRVELLIEAVLSLVRASKTRMPRLRMLQLDTRDEGELSALWECLCSDETAQINKQLAFKIQESGDGNEIRAWSDNVCTCGKNCFGSDSE